MNRYAFHEAVCQAMKNYAHTYVSDRGVKKSYMDVYPMSWENPKEDCGYGGVIKTLYIADGTPLIKRDILIALDKKPSSFSGTFNKLRAAGLINNVLGGGYILTGLGCLYAQAWLGDEYDENNQSIEIISSVVQSIKCCAAAIGCVAKTIGNSTLSSNISALQKSVDELMKSL